MRPEEALANMIANLKAKTGRSLEEWQEVIGPKHLAKHGEIVAFLKAEHGLSHGFANQIAIHTLKPNSPAIDGDPVEAMYAGPKQAVKPIHDALMATIHSFGPDIDVAPKKGYISIRRNKQFAIIQPSTAARVDLGINLKGEPATARLEPSGSFNAMLSHRVRLSAPADVDQQLTAWLRQAYDQA